MTDSNPTSTNHPFAQDNAIFLQQGIDLLEGLSDAQYAATLPPVFVSPVGAHIRHILDHFDSLLDGADGGRVDYDARVRDPRVENDRRFALQRLRETIARLDHIDADMGERTLRVKMDGGGGDDARTWGVSSLTRELQFLTSHTIHHYALVAAIVSHAGCAPQPGFGISPSTLRHERERARAAHAS